MQRKNNFIRIYYGSSKLDEKTLNDEVERNEVKYIIK